MRKMSWKHKLLLGALLLLLIPASWQCTKEAATPSAPMEAAPPATEHAGTVVAYDTPPEPIDGFSAIAKNLQYPESAKSAGIEGTVYLETVIQADGKVGEVKVARSSKHADLDQAAIESVKGTAWKPAMKEGEPITVKITIPVNFRLKVTYVEDEIVKVTP